MDKRTCVAILALFCLTTARVSSAATGAESRVARLLDGTQFAAPQVRMDGEGRLYFAERDEALEASRLVYWGHLEENLRQPHIILADGSRIVADVLGISSASVTIGTSEMGYTLGSIWKQVELPRSLVRGILFRPPTPGAVRDQLLDEFAVARTQDQAWLENGDRLAGSWLGPFTAEAFSNAEAAWQWKSGERELTVPRTQVVAIALAGRVRPPGAAEQGRGVVVGFAEGTRLAALETHVADDAVRFVLAGGIELETTPGIAWDQLCYVRPQQPTIRYLSDLEPLGYRHVPELTLSWPFGRDRNVHQGWLRTAAGLHEKGLGLHSTSRLAYVLPPQSQRVQCELALDRSAGVRGSVQLRVYTQSGMSDWSLVAESPIVRGDDAPVSLDVEVQGAERVALILDAADHGQQLDRANLLYARCLVAP